jgi:hypothetical protein
MAGFLDKFKSMVGMKPAEQPKNDPQDLNNQANAVRKPITGSETSLPCVEKVASSVSLPPVPPVSPSPSYDPQRPRKQSSTFVRLQALSASGTGANGPMGSSPDSNRPLTSLLDQLEKK